MTIAVTNIGTNQSGSASTLALSSVTVPSGSLIVVVTNEANTTAAGTVTDSAGNTYTKFASAANHNLNAQGWGAVYYAWNSLALSSGTITYTNTTAARAVVMTAFYATGIDATADPGDTTASSTGLSTTPSVTSGVPSASGELFVGAVTMSSAAAGDTFTQDANHAWATPPVAITVSGGGQAAKGGSFVNPGGTGLTYAPTITSRAWAAFLVSFRAPASLAANFGYVFG